MLLCGQDKGTQAAAIEAGFMRSRTERCRSSVSRTPSRAIGASKNGSWLRKAVALDRLGARTLLGREEHQAVATEMARFA